MVAMVVIGADSSQELLLRINKLAECPEYLHASGVESTACALISGGYNRLELEAERGRERERFCAYEE